MAFLLLEEILPIKKLPKVFCHLYTLLVVCMGFVMFRADTITQGIQMIGKMFTGWDFSAGMINVAVSQMNPLFDLTVVLGVVGSIPLLDKFRMLSEKAGGKGRAATAASYAGSFILLLLCMLSLSSGTYNPFIYFRF